VPTEKKERSFVKGVCKIAITRKHCFQLKMHHKPFGGWAPPKPAKLWGPWKGKREDGMQRGGEKEKGSRKIVKKNRDRPKE